MAGLTTAGTRGGSLTNSFGKVDSTSKLFLSLEGRVSKKGKLLLSERANRRHWKTARRKDDFELQEIGREQYEKIKSLIVEFVKKPPGKSPSGEMVSTRYYEVRYDFVLQKQAAALTTAE